MTRAAAVLVLAVVIALSGCTSGQPVTRSTVPGGTTPTAPSVAPSASSSLAEQKKAAGIADCPATEKQATPAENGLPDLTLGCLGGGRSVDLARLRGTPMVINIWAQWCGPCRKEAPYLAEVSAAAKGKVRFLGIDYTDPRPELAIAFAQEAGWTYPQLEDPEAGTRVPLKIPGPPVTIFVDAHGAIRGTHISEFASAAQLRTAIAEKLGVRV